MRLFGSTIVTLLAALALALPGAAAPPQAGTVYDFHSFGAVADASASLVRSANGASFTIQTSGLTPGNAYTVWWIVFNDPEYCSNGILGSSCGIFDLSFPEFGLTGDPRIGTSIVYGGGHVVGGSGRAGFAGRLAANDTSDAINGPGLVNPDGAVVWLDVLDHGPAENLPTQFKTFVWEPGSCNPTCADAQLVVFPEAGR